MIPRIQDLKLRKDLTTIESSKVKNICIYAGSSKLVIFREITLK